MVLLYKLQQSPDTVFNYLSDMEKFVAVHPVISRMKPTGNNHYTVSETLKLAFVPYSFNYQAIVQPNKVTKTILMKARIGWFAKIRLLFTIIDCGYSSVVKEELHCSSWLPVRRVMTAIVKKQHAALFRNIGSLENFN
jgi:carbon monoxide dehydrogenase subunit G